MAIVWRFQPRLFWVIWTRDDLSGWVGQAGKLTVWIWLQHPFFSHVTGITRGPLLLENRLFSSLALIQWWSDHVDNGLCLLIHRLSPGAGVRSYQACWLWEKGLDNPIQGHVIPSNGSGLLNFSESSTWGVAPPKCAMSHKVSRVYIIHYLSSGSQSLWWHVFISQITWSAEEEHLWL